MTEETSVLLTKKEVAQCLSCSVRNVDTLRKTAGLPYVLMGRLVRFRPSDIQEWMRSLNTIREEDNGICD
ncbi:MAG: helix-turn-helix domain-containing protein [Kiritimatiellae bacterium]|nr:helix-turn-helix domain-containing protein [Kiritimatiellia bacterium]